ncbi:MAG TPA: oligosaccharide flippase family protein [Acidobacteriaceae bacterium]|nr:oligosaccharide flippase family protein [Acidobacteriaceae bacterium]
MPPHLNDPISPASQNERLERSTRRFRGIAAAAASALLGRGLNLLVNAATVPLTIRYLGSEGYGLWVTISSAVTMFFVLDIGIASTLTNLISEAYAKSDREKASTAFATAFWLVMAITACLGLLGWALWPHVHWSFLFHVRDQRLARLTSPAMAAAFVVFICALPAGLATRILAGYQELHTANLFAAGGSVCSLIAIIAVIHFQGGLPLLVALYAGSAAGANLICLIWICLFHKPWLKPRLSLIRRRLVGGIFHSGSQFFVIQIAGLVVFNSDNLVISHFLSPGQVTPYNVTWRLVNYLTAIQVLVFPALWPAYSEAHAKGDLAWIRTTYAKYRIITIASLALGCVILAGFGQRIIRLWAGPAAVPPMILVLLMCVWMIIYAFTTNQSCLMGATARVKKQAIFSLIGAIVNLTLSVIWVRTLGVVGVLLGTIVSYLLFVVIPAALEVRYILQGKLLTAAPATASDPNFVD